MAVAKLDGSRQELPATLVEVAEHRLRDAILRGTLQPGEKIIEEQLCADFGISRAPLREALRLLGQQGLVEHLPRRGARVTDWSTVGHPRNCSRCATCSNATRSSRRSPLPTRPPNSGPSASPSTECAWPSTNWSATTRIASSTPRSWGWPRTVSSTSRSSPSCSSCSCRWR